ncbi:MAG: ComEA family DNA-binding protein [bacterium]
MGERINLNKATKDELVNKVGIGEVEASYIMDYRDSHGSILSYDELKSIKSITDTLAEDIEFKTEL